MPTFTTHSPTWNADLHAAALTRADALRQRALDRLFSTLGKALRRLLGGRWQPEA